MHTFRLRTMTNGSNWPAFCAARHPQTGLPITISSVHGILSAPSRFDVELFNRLEGISRETVAEMLSWALTTGRSEVRPRDGCDCC